MAVMTALPEATAVTNAVGEAVVGTVATPEALLAHVTVRPKTTVPLASFVIACSWTLSPTGMFTVAGTTVTEATGDVLPDGPLPPPHATASRAAKPVAV